MTKRILVTGAAGFMGSHLVDALLAEGHEVHALDDLSGGYRENVNPKAVFHQVDLRDEVSTRKTVEKIKPELVYHLAADATEGRSQFLPIDCTRRNYLAYLNLLVPAIKNGMKKIVMCSSMAVYGAQKPPFNEDLKPKPEDIYGISKFAMEEATKVLGDIHKFKWTILRPHNVYGPRQNMADPYRNVVAIFMNCLLRDKHFYIYGDGEQKRSFSYIEDQTPCIMRAGFSEECNGHIINIGPTKEYTINELAQTILEIAGKEHLKPQYLPSRPREVKYAWCTNEKACRMLGYKDRFSLRDGLTKMWEWAKQRGPMQPKYLDALELESGEVPVTWRNKLI
ncbi:MAG: NAD-dependent epimerase/dehydratase family protein [Candidatus Woesearchaeota archaeon]